MIEVYSRKCLEVRCCTVFGNSVLYDIRWSEVFLNIRFTEYLHCFSFKYFKNKLIVCRAKPSFDNLNVNICPQRLKVCAVLCACVFYCMFTTTFALVTISHQRPCESVLGFCNCYPPIPSTHKNFALFASPISSCLNLPWEQIGRLRENRLLWLKRFPCPMEECGVLF